MANPVSVPNSFTAGTDAVAAEVNANFTSLVDYINDNMVTDDGTVNITGTQTVNNLIVAGTLTAQGNLDVDGTLKGDVVANDGSSIVLSNGTNGSDATFKGDILNASGTTILDVSAATFAGNATTSSSTSGNAATATTLQTGRSIDITGVTATAQTFNGGSNISIPITAVPSSLLTGTISDARLPATITSSITGNAASADTVDVTANSHNSSQPLLFSVGAGAAQTVRNDSDVWVNPSFGRMNANYMQSSYGSTTFAAHTFNGDSNTGMNRQAEGVVGLLCNGTYGAIVGNQRTGFQASNASGTGTNAVLKTETISGVSMKVLYYDTSSREFKADIQDWSLTDGEFKSLRPVSFLPTDGSYIGPNGEHFGAGWEIDENGNEVRLAPPADALPIRRFGFILEELWETHLGLTTDVAPDDRALIAATIGKVQELMARVEALEAA